MKIGFMQFSPLLGDALGTMKAIERLLSGCAGVDLLVLPELCNSGYNFTSYEQAWDTSEAIEGGPFIAFLESKCSSHNMHIVSGLNERDGDVLYNSAVLIGPNGYIGTYRKLHLFLNERDFFQPGNAGLPVFDIGSCTLGMLVCFDWIFPEVWRILALKGAEIICHPSNLVLPGFAQRAIPIHALFNRVYVVTANRIGTEEELTFTGVSIIADPRGDILAQASRAKEEVVVREIHIALARDKMMTPRNHVLNDRRPQEYALLTENAIVKR
ncbi:MAG: carbon-nitrogen hydrolase [Deltaproteobacteria bacterium]|nr:MAG: carbon-nitrogen hydrolase [Deltaproteobacteria bacterium]